MECSKNVNLVNLIDKVVQIFYIYPINKKTFFYQLLSELKLLTVIAHLNAGVRSKSILSWLSWQPKIDYVVW